MTNAPANPESLTTEQPITLSRTERAIETRARRAAKREGYFMRKSRAALSIDNHGQFRLIDGNNNIVAGERFGMSAAEILEYLTADDELSGDDLSDLDGCLKKVGALIDESERLRGRTRKEIFKKIDLVMKAADLLQRANAEWKRMQSTDNADRTGSTIGVDDLDAEDANPTTV